MFIRVRPAEYELSIKRSRFIAFSRGIDSRSEAMEYVEELRRTYRDATHVCYAFIADEKGDEFGYDDDGEPSGTAGKPIYSALTACDAKKSLVAVVRYFGGIKLGTGGLTRAYRDSAAGVIEKAGLARAERYDVYAVNCDGDSYKKISQLLRNTLCKTERILYNETVSFDVVAPAGYGLAAALAPLGVIPKKTGERVVDTEVCQ